VEYWAALGRQVAEWLDPERLLEVKTGLARLKLEPVRAAAVDPGQVFAALEEACSNGSFSGGVFHPCDPGSP